MTPEEQTLRELDLQWYAAEQRKDVDAVLSFYADDAVYLTPNRPPVHGHQAIRQIVAAAYPTLAGISGEPMAVTVAASGDLAYVVGRERTRWQRSGSVIETYGSYLVVWKKVRGEWKAAAVSITNDEPLG